MGSPFDLVETRQALARTPATLRSLVDQLPAGARTYHEGPDAWSPVQVLCHLCDGEIDDWMTRVKLILTQPDTVFRPFDREAGFRRYQGWSAPALLDEFARLRTESLAEFDALDITPAHLSRTGLHPELGRVTLEQLLATWITHDFAHLTQLSRIATRYTGQSVGPWRAYFALLKDCP